jgi:hypothetical protein
VKIFRILIPVILICFFAETASAQKSFQRGRKAVQKQRFAKTTGRYGKACEIFEKKRVKGQKKPILDLGLGRKRKPKMAEQN